MKKILIAVGALGVMSFTTNQLYLGTQLLAAMDNITDLQQWIQEDVKQLQLILVKVIHFKF